MPSHHHNEEKEIEKNEYTYDKKRKKESLTEKKEKKILDSTLQTIAKKPKYAVKENKKTIPDTVPNRQNPEIHRKEGRRPRKKRGGPHDLLERGDP